MSVVGFFLEKKIKKMNFMVEVGKAGVSVRVRVKLLFFDWVWITGIPASILLNNVRGIHEFFFFLCGHFGFFFSLICNSNFERKNTTEKY